MIYIKSSTEIAKMKVSGRIVFETLKEVEKHIKAGITTKELDQIAKEYILSQGAKPSFLGYNGHRNPSGMEMRRLAESSSVRSSHWTEAVIGAFMASAIK